MNLNEVTLGNIPKRTILLVILAMLFSGCTTTASQKTDPRSIVFPFQYIGNIDKAHLNKPNYNPSGICFHSKRGTLFVVVDLIELEPETFDVLREFPIPREFKGDTLLKAGGQGIEAITFVPDTNHPHGGTFYVANQSYNLEDTEDIYIAQDSGGGLKIKWNK